MYTMTSSEKCANWRSQIESLSSDACLYRHHLADTTKAAPLCDGETQNRTHGCAHAMRYILINVVQEMGDAGLISRKQAENFGIEIRQQRGKLFQDDTIYQLEDLTLAEENDMRSRQKAIIDRRVEIAQKLLAAIELHEPSYVPAI